MSYNPSIGIRYNLPPMPSFVDIKDMMKNGWPQLIKGAAVGATAGAIGGVLGGLVKEHAPKFVVPFVGTCLSVVTFQVFCTYRCMTLGI